MSKYLLLGDEAIAQGAIDSGMSGIYAYPGTPSTEITEYVQKSAYAKEKGIHSIWSANEKTAMESALGMSYAGKRAMVCMKHVGLNVAADAFINAAITGVNGGLIVTVADDPSMHSSQNEQDSRFYGKFAMIPILEPANQQEAYDMAYEGFKLSERYKLPVMIRITTRLAHSRSVIERKQTTEENKLSLPDNLQQFILLPAFARIKYKNLLSLHGKLEEEADKTGYNIFRENKNSRLGIIACGITYNYLMENFLDKELFFDILKIGQYPAPSQQIQKMAKKHGEILVLEEGYPLIEEQLKGIIPHNIKIKGRLDGSLPRDGELNPYFVGKALDIETTSVEEVPEIVQNRPPALCKGCSHVDVFNALNESLQESGAGKVFSDIGCYTLGALPPFNAINSCVDMGASISMAKGAADAGLRPAVAVIGDSTFTHSGMTGLLDAVVENTPMTIIISDNATTAMTGGQNSSATGRLEKICEGIGVAPAHFKILTPLKKHHDENMKIIKEELAYNGVSVIIARRECIQTARRKKKVTK